MLVTIKLPGNYFGVIAYDIHDGRRLLFAWLKHTTKNLIMVFGMINDIMIVGPLIGLELNFLNSRKKSSYKMLVLKV